MQEELESAVVEATSGGGAVKVVVSGKLAIESLTIDPEAVSPDDVEMLQDLIAAAVNQAQRRAREMAQEEMQKLSGIPLGGLFDNLNR